MEAPVGLVLPWLTTPLKPMNYIHAENSIVIEYPYSVEKLRSDNPDTSFPSVMSEEELSAWSVYPLAEEAVPAFNEATEQLEEKMPTFENGIWASNWIITELSAKEKEKATENKANSIRIERNKRLKDTDITQLQDFPCSATEKLQWIALRQYLRDMPSMNNFPWSVTWPILEDF